MRWGMALFVLASAACGARSPLEIEERLISDAGSDDARSDARSTDAGPDGFIPPRDCEMCSDDQNASGPPDESCVHGAQWLAWEWLPECNMLLRSIDVHITSEGELALLNDTGGRPGRVLARGSLEAPDRDGWRTADLGLVEIEGGRPYWIAEMTLDCGIMERGTIQQRYYGSNELTGGWDGPFVQYFWGARIEGICE